MTARDTARSTGHDCASLSQRKSLWKYRSQVVNIRKRDKNCGEYAYDRSATQNSRSSMCAVSRNQRPTVIHRLRTGMRHSLCLAKAKRAYPA